MLQTLERVDQSRSRAILSRATESLIPRAMLSTYSSPLSQEDEATVREVLGEVEARVTSKVTDAEQRRRKMLDVLSAEITRVVLPDDQQQAVRARLGESGKLPEKLYRLTFSPKFNAVPEFWGVKKQHVENAIYNCDVAQHFTTKLEGSSGQPSSSLFIQHAPVKDAPYTILVKCQRNMDMLTIDEAYRVYGDEIDLVGATRPVDVLARFLDRLGVNGMLEITGDRPVRRAIRFIEDEIFEVPFGASISIAFDGAASARLTQHNPRDNRVELTLFYSVHTPNYVAYLSRHGVKAKAGNVPSSFTLRTVPVADT